MSTSQRSAHATSYKLSATTERSSVCASINAGGVAERVYSELGALARLMPTRYAALCSFRWGLHGEFPHLASQVASKFEIPQATAEGMLSRVLWNLARYGQCFQLPALSELLGEDRAQWAERAWQHAERRWGNNDAQFSEAVLLLSVAGLPVPDAHAAARQHMINIGVGKTNKWGTPLTEQQRCDRARDAVNRILEQVIWPSNPARLHDLSAFTLQRPLPWWAPEKSGVFKSKKLGRRVQFDSTLELVLLRDYLEVEPRIVGYQEQPLTITYELNGYAGRQAHDYTPDAIALLDDGGEQGRRAFVIEAKPYEHLGVFSNWIKWANLARYCEEQGLGWWVGSPERSLIEHRAMRPDPEKHELITGEVKNGPVTGEDYKALVQLVGYQQLGLTASAELLDWRTDLGQIKHAEGADRQEAQQLWDMVGKHLRRHDLPNRTGGPTSS